MKKKRPRRKPAKPPPQPATPRRGFPARSGFLEYKIVELSTVDEGSLERALNQWTAKGWNLENVQFAMRESSKRPAMAFVFFTREQERLPDELEAESPLHPSLARERLVRLANEERGPAPALVSPRERLAQLADEDDFAEAPEQRR